MSSEAQLKIRLITRQLCDAVLEPTLSVPTSIKVKGLNDLVNGLLSEEGGASKVRQFAFVVNGELLRSTLSEHLHSNANQYENIVNVEYFEKIAAPIPHKHIEHNDWVSSVHSYNEYVLSGCYDGCSYIWTNRGNRLSCQKKHMRPVKAVKWLQHNGFVTTSQDSTGILWQWSNHTEEPKPLIVLKGHERSVDCISVHPTCGKLATGGWDAHLRLWSGDLDADDEENQSNVKRAKGGNDIKIRRPICTLKGHKESISCIDWMDNNRIATASMDHTLKIWNSDLGGMQSEFVGEKAFLGVSWSPLSKLLLTCAADRSIRLYDPRYTEKSVCKQIFTSHSAWVSAVTWCKHDSNLFVSGSYDAMVKIWDCRCVKAPLYDLVAHRAQVMALDWSNEKYIMTSASDNNLLIYRTTEDLSNEEAFLD